MSLSRETLELLSELLNSTSVQVKDPNFIHTTQRIGLAKMELAAELGIPATAPARIGPELAAEMIAKSNGTAADPTDAP